MDSLQPQHLSQIQTIWTVVQNAHAGQREAVHLAQEDILRRYSPAVFRYLLGAVRDADAAEEIFQEFALRFVRGDFRRADPGRGRFRDFLKTSLYHLIVDHQRRQKKQFVALAEEPAAAPEPTVEDDRAFLASWREELMARAWTALETHERQTGEALHTVLRFRTDNTRLQSSEMAEQLSTLLGKPVTPGWVRKRLHFARALFTDLLLKEIEQTLPRPTLEELEDEVLALGLLDYCRDALVCRRETRGS